MLQFSKWIISTPSLETPTEATVLLKITFKEVPQFSTKFLASLIGIVVLIPLPIGFSRSDPALEVGLVLKRFLTSVLFLSDDAFALATIFLPRIAFKPTRIIKIYTLIFTTIKAVVRRISVTTKAWLPRISLPILASTLGNPNRSR